MLRLGLAVAGSAALLIALWQGVLWLREDARQDLIKEQLIRQAEQDAASAAERAARKEEIENASPDERHRRACTIGLLPPDACS